MPSASALTAVLLTAFLGTVPPQGEVVVASKNFTEAHILGELFALMLEQHTDLEVEHRSGLGGTLVCFTALENGEIDLYPDYTGTLWATVLKESEKSSDPMRVYHGVQKGLRDLHDVELLHPLGLNNTYAIAMEAEKAEARGLRTLSDLRGQEDLRAGFSIEFVHREDGWEGLGPFYGIELAEVRPMEHALAYEALMEGSIDLIDAYSTDAKLERFGLHVLEDDRGFFPPYHAAPLVRRELLADHPEVGEVLGRLSYRISDEAMTRMNHRVEVGGEDFREVARSFLLEEGLLADTERASEPKSDRSSFTAFLWSRRGETWRLFVEHLWLTLIAVSLAALVAIPVGIWLTKHAAARRIALTFAGVMQTVPSLALLAFLIAVPGLGLTVRSAIAALFLYALLPILRNTHTGVDEVDPDIVDAARGMGLTPRQILFRIQLPLATRTIMAGVRTATVISIGVATLAAFIGAGGLGEPIVTGLYLNDPWMILSGAIPAALMALLADAFLARMEQVVVPRGLRLR